MPEGGIVIEVSLTRTSKKTTNPDPSLSIDFASSHFPVRLPSCQCCIGPLAHYLGMSPPHDHYGRTGLIQTFWQSSITIKYTLVTNGYPKIRKTKPLSTMGHLFLYVFFFLFHHIRLLLTRRLPPWSAWCWFFYKASWSSCRQHVILVPLIIVSLTFMCCLGNLWYNDIFGFFLDL